MKIGIANILVVDDEPQLLKDSLPLYGYNIDVAKDGLQAIENLKENKTKYDLILLDINMPKMNGWELLKKIRDDLKFEKIPILMLTGSKEAESEVASLKHGADAYVVKPIRIPVLLAHIEALIRRSKIFSNIPSGISMVNFTTDSNNEISELSAREKEILKFVAEGKNNKEVADILSIQEVTVKSHLKNIFKKLNVTNRMQAVILALKINLLD